MEALAAGELVAFPTETVYGLAASPFVPEAIARLQRSKDRSDDKPLTLALADPASAMEWLPAMSPLGRRLARRCWPGPVTLVVDEQTSRHLLDRLPESVRPRVCPTGTVGLRIPDHHAILEVMASMSGPLVLTSANRSGSRPQRLPNRSWGRSVMLLPLSLTMVPAGSAKRRPW